MILPFLIGLSTYISSTLLSYSDKVKASNYYFAIGLALAILANTCWLYIAKNTPDKHQIYVYALFWDSMIVGSFTLIPIIALGVRLNWTTAIGCALIVAGMILTKIAS